MSVFVPIMIIPVYIQSAMMAGQEPCQVTLLVYMISYPPPFTLLRRRLGFKDYDQSTPQRHACRVTPLCSWSTTVNITVCKICDVIKQFLGWLWEDTSAATCCDGELNSAWKLNDCTTYILPTLSGEKSVYSAHTTKQLISHITGICTFPSMYAMMLL